jgi:simple sugar transport system substrate-binding protein
VNRTPLARALALGGALALFLTACSEGGRQQEDDAAPAAAAEKTMTAVMVTHAGPGDTFWDIARRGAEAAAERYGVDLQYSGDPDAARQSQLAQQAVDQGTDGLALTFSKGEALQSVTQNAVDAGIPVVGFNGGMEEALDYGAFTFIGQDDGLAGEALGDLLAEQDFTHPICVIHEQGNVGLEARCAGVKEKLPDTETLYVQGTDMTQVSSTVTAKLQSTADADVVIGLGAPFTLTIVDAVEETGSEAKVASFDLNADLAQAVADGDVLATVDQQPYLQGYMAIESLWLQHNGGFVLGGGQPVFTGPAIIDQDNAADVLTGAKDGIR